MKQREYPVKGRPKGVPKGAPFGWAVSGKTATPLATGDREMDFQQIDNSMYVIFLEDI